MTEKTRLLKSAIDEIDRVLLGNKSLEVNEVYLNNAKRYIEESITDHQPAFTVAEYYKVCTTTKLTYKVTPNDITERQETKFYVDYEDRFVKMNLHKEAIERDKPATAEQIATFKRAEHFADHGRKLDEFEIYDEVYDELHGIGKVIATDTAGEVTVGYTYSIGTKKYSYGKGAYDQLELIQTAEELREVGE